jgi:alginate O-acetyltransferase complex protein AlgI
MLFNSYEFIFMFLPLTWITYFYLNHLGLERLSKMLLVACSLFFYSWWNIAYLPLIVASVAFNFFIGKHLSRDAPKGRLFSRKVVLYFGVISNLALLAYFKYSDFFIENINYLFDQNVTLLNLALPLAISFFTFQQISYLVDSHKSENHEYDFLNYALFVTFFPQLIAGPIVHHKEMMPQFSEAKNRNLNHRNISLGMFVFAIGLFKKVAIADSLAVAATQGFDVAETLNFVEAWATSLSYTFQLYFDFSGYTDMALGLALLFNIRLPVNFNSPYKATNIQDFWRRWHMTLSRFLKDYVYIPLGGNQKGDFRTYNNLLATFILGGIWHGAGWTFVFWGFLHGAALVTHRFWSRRDLKMWNWLAWLITFNFVNIAWVFFRAQEWSDALKVLGGMFNLHNIVLPRILYSYVPYFQDYGLEFGGVMNNLNATLSSFIWLTLAFILSLLFKNSIEKLHNFKSDWSTLVTASVLLAAGILHLSEITEFLYFDF